VRGRRKVSGVPAAAWFYAQPGFHGRSGVDDNWTFHVAEPLDPLPPAKHEQGRDGRCHLCDGPWPCQSVVLDAARYLKAHWPAYWIVLDTWPAELRQAVAVLRGV
jgi:hypothetical protein